MQTVFAVLLPFVVFAKPQPVAFNDNIDRTDPNFVKASLMMVTPGGSLFSRVGHAFLRMECPTFGHDYCFSYESEPVRHRILTYFAGKLRMGMFAIPYNEFIESYASEGRGITQYELNLPPDAKQRLWKLMDDEVKKGPDLPYDYVERGCALSLMRFLTKALEPYQIVPGEWSERYKLTRRELLCSLLSDCPWDRVFVQLIMGTYVDGEFSNFNKIGMPIDLLEFLQKARIGGRLVIDKPGKVVLADQLEKKAVVVTPLVVSCGFLVVAIVNLFMKSKVVDMFFLAVATLIGLLIMFLLVVSRLPATNWSWPAIPFNVFPAVLWHWRRHWSLLFVVVLIAWECFMICSTHQLTDPAFLLLTASYVVFYLRFVPVFAFAGRARTPAAPQKGVTA